MDELRFALRRLSAHAAASVVSIVTLGCAIGAAAAAWALVSASLLHPLRVHDPEHLVVVGQRMDYGSAAGMLSDGVLYPTFQLIQQAGIFEATGAHWTPALTLTGGSETSVARITAGFVTPNFFSVLGVRVTLGRQLTESDDRRGAPPVAILTDQYWRQAFGGDRSIVGRTMRVAEKPVTIVGVLQRGFRGVHLADAPDLFLPLQTIVDIGSPYTNYLADPRHPSSPTAGVAVVGRLRPDQSMADAAARLRALPSMSSTQRDHLGLMDVDTAALPPLARRSLPQFTLLLAATVGLLLLIGCGAVGTLLLIRTDARREEFAMCMALGASRWMLARGVGAEGLLLALGGASLAVPTASWLMDGVRAFELPGHVDVSRLDLAVDTRVLLLCAIAALAATAIVTLIASAFGFTANVADALKSRNATRPTRRWSRTLLVAAQVAFALVLVVGAGLFARSLIAALQLNSNLDAARLLTTYVSRNLYGRPGERDQVFFDDLMTRLQRDPAIAAAAYSSSHGSMLGKLSVDGVERQYAVPVTFDGVDDQYFETLKLPVLEGRAFTAADRRGAPPVAIVSRSFARVIAPGASALGHRITRPEREIGRPPDVVEIVGIVPDVVENVNALEPLAVYLPLAQLKSGASRTLTVRAAGDVDAARRSIVSTIKVLDSTVMPRTPATIEESILRQLNAQQFGIVVLGALAALAMLLTALATYVLAESTTSMRLREMGIRASLGATGAQLGWLVIRETGRLAGLGVLCGLGMAWFGAGAIRALLFRVQPLDPLTLGAAAVLILAVAAIVSVRPAIRAARVDVAQLLRQA